MSRPVFVMIAVAMAVFPLAGTGSTDSMTRTVSAKASSLVRTCTDDREYPTERVDNLLIVMVAGV